jgi:O-acetyl-ADP-ribose deacetylase (regulator of RNase III)
VGPIYGHEEGNDDVLLAVCYRNSLLIAKENNLKTIAFPCISTGVFKFPKDKAAEIAINTIESFIKKYPEAFEEIVFVTHEELDYDIYNRYLLELA